MGRLLRRNIWIEAGISLFLMLFFIYFYCHIDQWVIETLPSTISPAFFPSVVTLVLIIMSSAAHGVLPPVRTPHARGQGRRGTP